MKDYASVVSGGGGASMSPTQTDYGEVPERALYPSKEISTRVINKQLFKPWVVIAGGNVWMAGLNIAMIVYLGASIPAYINFTNSFLDNVARWFSKLPYFPAASAPHPVDLSIIMVSSGHLGKLALLLLASLGAIIGAGTYARWLFERLTKTYDWATDRRENLRLGEALEEKSSEERSLFDHLFGLYSDLLNKIRAQTDAGVPRSMLHHFWWRSSLGLIAVGLLCGLEFSPWSITLGWYSLMFFIFLIFSGISIAYIHRLSKSRFKDFKSKIDGFLDLPETTTPDETKQRTENEVKQVTQFTVTPLHDYVPFWSLLVLAVGLFFLVTFEYWHPERFGAISPFGKSLLILFSIFIVAAAAIVAIYYSKWLFDQSYRIKVNLYSYGPVMALSAIALGVLTLSLVFFAVRSGRSIIINILYLLALIAVPGGCIALAVFVGNHLPKKLRGFGFGVMGFWHGALQLVVPLLLVWIGDWKALLLALLLVVIFNGGSLLVFNFLSVDKKIMKWVLTVVWVVFGVLMIFLPFISHKPNLNDVSTVPAHMIIWGSFLLAGVIGASLIDLTTVKRFWVLAAAAAGGIAGWLALTFQGPLAGTCVLAGLIGAVMSCVWLGWYFAVSLGFDGHANEAGSTARTEDYKQFIRFRITKDSLTGFVIGVDFPHAPREGEDPRRDGLTLKPRLIDVFTLKCNSRPLRSWEDM